MTVLIDPNIFLVLSGAGAGAALTHQLHADRPSFLAVALIALSMLAGIAYEATAPDTESTTLAAREDTP